mmetsp:Transcript_29821/g.68705  ORF Transcript_29821/g.68705 Transcript_29821/m.68705 type:complete len:107 (+) Transcript_29821:1285-1605(+)
MSEPASRAACSPAAGLVGSMDGEGRGPSATGEDVGEGPPPTLGLEAGTVGQLLASTPAPCLFSVLGWAVVSAGGCVGMPGVAIPVGTPELVLVWTTPAGAATNATL